MLVEYDARWPLRFEEAAQVLRNLSGGDWVVEHIGSTSVPGLAAKPIIDLAVKVDDFRVLDDLKGALEREGWLALASGPKTHEVRVRQDGHVRTHIAHFFTADQWDPCNQRIFRDWLRDHPEDRELYEATKWAAAESATSGRDYTLRKREVVQQITDRARLARGLPLVDVWDK